MKQIKLSNTHYIVVDDNGTRTYSTLEIKGVGYYPLSLAKEIAGEVDVNEKAYKYAIDYRCPATNDQEYCKHDIIAAYNNGYNQCLEDNKDKKYTEEDLRNVIRIYSHAENELSIREIIQSLQPPTEWEVEIVEGKLKRK